MKITVFNENRLTRQPFFKALIEYLSENTDVTLRQMHKDFDDVRNLDRQIDTYINAGLLERKDKRYNLAFQVFEDKDFDLSLQNENVTQHIYTKPFFVESGSQLENKLSQSVVHQRLVNDTNDVKIHQSSRLDRNTETLGNYFFKCAENYPLSKLESEVYEIMGDVNADYALKYMTTFLLKFLKKDRMSSTRPDIFVQVLEKYQWIEQVEDHQYKLLVPLQETENKIEQTKHDSAHSFIQAQIKQINSITPYISIN